MFPEDADAVVMAPGAKHLPSPHSRNPAVRVNCISPAPVMLPVDVPETERRQVVEATLVKRESRPEDVGRYCPLWTMILLRAILAPDGVPIA